MALLLRAWLAAVLVALAASAPAAAPDTVPVPPMRALVTDLTGTLTGEQQAALETRLREFGERKGSQVAVLVVRTTAPEPIETYSLRVVEQWKVGRRNVDDGILLLVAKDDRAVRIEVGYGLEGALPDATAKRIVSELIVPRLAAGDFAGGIDAGVDRILRTVDGEPLPPPAAAPQTLDIGRLVPILLLGPLMFGAAMRRLLSRLPGAGVVAAGVAALAWFLSGLWTVAAAAAAVAFLMTLGGRGVGIGPFGSSGGGFGGFGGGGGGRFGGGGASGRW
jgi:uncharacterized protein